MDPTQPTTPQPASQPDAPVWGPPPAAPSGAPAPVNAAPTMPAVSDWGPPPTMPVPAATPVVAAKAPRRRDPMAIVLVLAGFVAVAGVGFAAGRVTAPTPAVATRGGGFGNFGGGNGAGNGGGNGAGGGAGNGGLGFGAAGRFAGGLALRGTVTEIAADHITLQLTSGGTITIPINSSTTYHTSTPASSSAVTSGASVLVQLQPTGAFGGGQASPNPSGGVNPQGNGNGNGGGRGAVGPAQDITVVGQ